MAEFATARDVSRATSEIIRPSRRMLPSEAAAEFKLRDKEGKDWAPDIAPYMVEPLDLLASRRYQGIVFVGPARTSKTFSLLHAGLNYIVTCAPGDTTVVQSSNDTARRLSKFEFEPVVRNSAGLRGRLSPRASDNNTFDKVFRSGMVVKFAWPAVTQLSGDTLRYIIMPDYDRPENRDNVDGEGPLWDLAWKRIQTAMSRGKCMAESSPGEDFVDASWAPITPHQAPPARGILSLYNQGTMAQFYWPCQGCGERMRVVPGYSMFGLPEFRELAEAVQTSDLAGLAAEYGRVVCNRCGHVHDMPQRRALNLGGRWLHEHERFDAPDRIVGNRIETSIASFWLGGAAAAFQRWDSMLLGYFEKVREWARTGDENGMRTKTNVDAGAAYMPRAAANRRKAEDLIKRAEIETWARGTVPKGVCFLVGAVDIQSNRFVVSIYGKGAKRETWLVDRFELAVSKRLDGDGRPLPMEPATYDEDWDVLTDELIARSYPLEEDAELSMPVLYSHCDSGGAASAHGVGGVTHRAYAYWRRLAAAGTGNRFWLVKGANSVDAKRLEERWPDSKNEADRMLGARGDVPVWFINTTTFKDAMFGDLNRDAPGPGYVHLPHWLDRKIFAEYVAEARGVDGWKKKPGQRNEQGDLHVYADAAYTVLGAENINWDAPPDWAKRPSRAQAETPSEETPAESEWERRARLLNAG